MSRPTSNNIRGHSIVDIGKEPNFFMKASLGLIPGVYVMNKFAHSGNIDTATDPQDIWDGSDQTFSTDAGIYTYSTTADIDSISSSVDADNMDITIIGLDTNWNKVTQTITLTGRTRAALTTDLIRIHRAFNANGTATAGDAYIFVDGDLTLGVPNAKDDIRAKILISSQQTEMSMYAVPAGKTALLFQWYAGMAKSSVAAAISDITYSIREFGGIFRDQGHVGLNTVGAGHIVYKYASPNILPEKTDIKATCNEVSANDSSVTAGYDLLIFDNAIWGL